MLALGGCGPGPKSGLEPTPEWRSERDKTGLRLKIAADLIDVGAITEGLQLLADIRQEGTDTPELDYLQGLGLSRQGLASEAETLLLASAKHLRKDARPWRELGLIYADTDRPQMAIDALQTALEYDDRDAASWNNLGFLQLSEKQYAPALESSQQAVALDGSVARYRNNLGFAFAANDRPEEAFRAFRSAGTVGDAHANLGLAYELHNDPDNALQQFTKALEYSPSHVLAQQGLSRLQNLTDSETEEESP